MVRLEFKSIIKLMIQINQFHNKCKLVYRYDFFIHPYDKVYKECF